MFKKYKELHPYRPQRLTSFAITALELPGNFCVNTNYKPEIDASWVLTIHPFNHHHFFAGQPHLQHPHLFVWLLEPSLWPAGARTSQHQPCSPQPMTDRKWDKHFSSLTQEWKWRG